MIQSIVLTATVVLMGVVTAVFLFVAYSTRNPVDEYAPLQTKAYSIRAKFFWLLTVSGIVITVMTTLDLPYAATRGDIPEGAVTVNVEGRQWYWELDKQSAQAGDTVIFNVSALDVSHGLGVYDPDMRLIGQTQAMPGYVNLLEVDVNKPGNYKLLCLEYCGLAHHAMVSEFTVAEKPGEGNE